MRQGPPLSTGSASKVMGSLRIPSRLLLSVMKH
jgi:hypothetical protein